MKSIELFSGTGGLALGLEMAGFTHEALFEWDEDSCQNVNHNIESGYDVIKQWKVFQTDVRDVDYSKYSSVDFIAGGPPCQPFSLGGKHKANNDHRDMFPEAVRAVREIKPMAFVFENVKGLLRPSFSKYFDYIILQLKYPEVAKKDGESWEQHMIRLEEVEKSGKAEGLTYNVTFKLLNAADYGVPQVRHRVFIVGFRSDLNITWNPPIPTHSKEALALSKWETGEYWREHHMIEKLNGKPTNAILERYKLDIANGKIAPLRWRTVRDAISDLPKPETTSLGTIHNHELRLGARSYAGHSGCALDEPSKTIKAGSHGVPGGENMVVLDDGSLRYYTVRESARIQTFPDEYLFSASWTESMRQIGNAVPVLLAKIVGDSVMKQMKGVLKNGK